MSRSVAWEGSSGCAVHGARGTPSPHYPQRHSVVPQSPPSPVTWQLRALDGRGACQGTSAGTLCGSSGPTPPARLPAAPTAARATQTGRHPWSDPTCTCQGHLATKFYCGYCLRPVFSSPAGGKLAQEGRAKRGWRGAGPKAAASCRWEVHVLL